MREKISGILWQLEAPIVLELGAHDGTDTRWLRQLCPRGRLIALEPDLRLFQVLKQTLGHTQTHLVPAAVAEQTGIREMHLSDNPSGLPASSSLLRPKEHLQRWPWCTFTEVQLTPCFSLDLLFAEFGLEHVDLIWADIQGAEKEMVLGGRHALAMADWLYCESYDFEAYEGQALRHEFLAMLPAWDLVDQDQENVLLRRRK